MSKLQTYISERKKLFREKCTESFAKGGFLTTDLVGDWALDKELTESFNEETIEGCLAIVREVVDGHKEVYTENDKVEDYLIGEEKEHADSCCNETIDDILQALNTKE